MSEPPQNQEHRRAKRELLAQYYGTSPASASSSSSASGGTNKIADAVERQKSVADPRRAAASAGQKEPMKQPEQQPVSSSPFDIDSSSFDPEAYSQMVIKEASLTQLMAKEGEIVRNIHSLDSDMQTLVYENYNKFIAATDTIKKMRVDFRDMEDEMDQLAEKMKSVTENSAKVNDALKDRRSKVSDLSSTHALLKKLQFLFELPSKLKECIDEENWALGVKFYVRAQRVLDQYRHVASFGGIKGDCDKIMIELRDRLRERLKSSESTPTDMAECVHLLLQLNEPIDQLCDDYLETSNVKLQQSLESMTKQVEVAQNSNVDVLEFVDQSCNTFLSDLNLVMASFNDTFMAIDESKAAAKLTKFVLVLMEAFTAIIKERMLLETNLGETALLIRALDRFHRRLQATCRLMPTGNSVGKDGGLTLSKEGMSLILDVAKHTCQVTLDKLKDQLDESLLETRKILVAPRPLNTDSSGPDLRGLNRKLLGGISDRLRGCTTNLQLFLDPELTFAVKTNFRTSFCRAAVREGVVVAHCKQIIGVCQDFCSDDSTEKTVPPILLLLLSRTCLDLQSSTIQNVMSVVDEQFFIDDSSGGLTTVNKLGAQFKNMSQTLLNHYVRLEGQVLSQMLRKSIETRDWLNSVEPRSVRAVMKRIVEETTSIDRQVGELYEEGARKARSSDSSRRTRLSHRAPRSWTASTTGQLSTSLASNIQKMFNEKIEVFSPVEASKVSILTGIIKIALKTMLECMRLRTFSRYGFQQMQVDVHYLNLYLWRFVSDENLVSFLLDEAMTSAVHRCPDPVPMEHSVVEVICDRS